MSLMKNSITITSSRETSKSSVRIILNIHLILIKCEILLIDALLLIIILQYSYLMVNIIL